VAVTQEVTVSLLVEPTIIKSVSRVARARSPSLPGTSGMGGTSERGPPRWEVTGVLGGGPNEKGPELLTFLP
jgi:hypothetical protein